MLGLGVVPLCSCTGAKMGEMEMALPNSQNGTVQRGALERSKSFDIFRL